MSAVIPFFQPLSRLLSRLWKKANRVAAAEDLAAPLASSDLDELPASAKSSQATVEAPSKPAVTAAEAEPVVISFEAPNQRAARLQAQAKELDNAPIVAATKTGPETKPKLSHQIEKAVADYVLALKLNHCSPATIRNYKSDIKQFCDFGHEKELSKIFTKPKLLEFAQAETDRGLQSSTVKRKLISIAQFAVWARKGKLITDQRLIESLDRAETPDLIQFSTPAPIEKPETVGLEAAAATGTAPASTQPEIKKPDFSGPSANKAVLRFTLPALPETVVTKWLPYFNLAILSVFVIGLGIFTLRQFQNASPSLAYPTTLTRPNRMLSFQGRITNTADTPIVGATNMRFRLFDDVAAGTQLWDSNVCSIDPDQDGIFNTNLGAGAGAGADTENCGAEIAETVFSENPNVWLQVTIGAETLTPRQPIRTVAYALNSETLQGFPAATTATENTVLVMNNSGEVVLGSTAPAIRSTGTSFTLEGNAVTLKTTAASGTDLTLTGDKDVILNTAGTGVVIAQDYLAAPGATLSATYAGGRALTLQAGPSATADIMQWLTSGGTVLGRISSAGQIGIGNVTPEQDLNVASNLQLGVTDGTRYIYFDNGTGNNAGIRYDSATDKMQFSNDGTTWSDMDSGAGAVTSVSNSDGSLTISPTTGVVVASLNLANANTWTGLQTFDNTNTDFAQYLRHSGDTNTFLNFTTDKLTAGIGGKNLLDLDTNAVQDAIVLGDGTDVDTQILADTSITGLFVEGSTGRVGVGTNAPGAYQLDVAGSTNLSTGNAYYINGSSVLNATTLGTGVTGSSLTSVGALASGSIASGFGTITTANTITGTTLNGTTGINTGASAGTQRIDSSGNLVNIGTTQLNTVTYSWPGADGTNGYILSTNGTGTLSWADPAVIVANSGYFGSALGSVYVKNNTQDFLVGGQASTSAKFAFMNVNSGTPTASISGTTANVRTFLTGEGNLATTNKATLTVGGSSTGDIQLSPGGATGLYVNGAGNVGIGTTAPGESLEVKGAGTGKALIGQWATSTDYSALSLSGAIGYGDYNLLSSVTDRALYINRPTGRDIQFREGHLLTQLTIKNTTGNVGVGDSSPASLFTVGSGDLFQVNSSGAVAAATGITSSGNIDLASLSAGGIVKAAATTGRLSIATGGTDYENPLTFGNGLTRTVDAVALGGSLTGNTTIALGSNTFALSGNGSMIVGGTTADGKFQINGTADDQQLIVRGNGTQTSNLVEFQDNAGSALAYVSGTGVLNGASLSTGGTSRISGAGNLTNIGTTQLNSVTYTWPGADGTSSFILSTNGAGTLSWADPSTVTAGSNYWATGLGSVYLKNSTQDFLLGGQATASSKFAVLNMNTGTPTASISGTTANVATFLTGEGNLSTTNRTTLTIGGAATGDIQLSAHGTTGLNVNSSGNVGIGTATPGYPLEVRRDQNAVSYMLVKNGTAGTAAAAGIAVVRDGTAGMSMRAFSASYTSSGLDIANAGQFRTDAGLTGGMVFSTGTTAPIIFGNNSAEAMRLTGGNLGIGDSSPASLFTVGSGDLFQVNSSGAVAAATGITSSGNIDLAALSAGGIVKAAATTGRLSIATGGTDFESPLTFGNGLTRTVNAVALGGSLTGNTTIALGSNTFALSGNGSMIVGGTTADGKFQINGTADDQQLIVRANGTQTSNLVEFQDNGGSALAYISGTGALNGASLSTGGTARIGGTGNLTNIGTTQLNTVTYTWPGADGSGSYVLSTNGSGTLSWSDPATITAGSNYWMTGLGSVYLKNTTQDFLLGSQATVSSKFAVLNMNTGTPTASISGTTTNVRTFLTGEGNLSTTNRATLTIGGTATGDIQLSPHGATGLYMNATGNVGIGDTTPASLFTVGSGDLFQVNSSGAIAAATGITSSGTITFSGLTNNRLVIAGAGGALGTSITSANMAASITNETGGSGVAVFNSSPTFVTDITTPKVVGGTGTGSNLTLQSTSGSGATDYIAFTVGNAGGTEAMRIINSGNVGIGATNPAARLQVNGSSDIVQFAVRGSSTQTSNLQEWQDNSGTVMSSINASGEAYLTGLTVSAYTFPTTDGTSGYVLSTNGSGAVTWADPVALTAASNYWGSALGSVYVKNNTQDLLVGGQASTSAKFAFMNVNSGTPTASISGTTANVRTFLTGEGNLATTNMATLTLGGATTGDIRLSPNNTTGLRVNGLGYVGINTATPSEALEIYNANSLINRGQLKFTQETTPGALTDNDSGVAGNPNGTYTYRVTFVTANGETEGGTISGGVTVASKQISLTGIPTGTTGVVTGRNIYRTTNGGSSYRRLGSSPTIADNTTTTFTDNVADGSLNVATAPTSNTTAGGLFVGGSSRLNIDQLGRVGIGTTQPSEKIEVADDANTYLKVTAITGSGQTAGIKLQRGERLTDTYTDYDILASGGDLYINSLIDNGTATRFFIEDDTGFTGIGTITPNLKLDVSGNSSSLTNLLALSNDNATTNSGTGFVIKGKDSANNWTDFGGLSSIITDATNTSEDGRVTIKEMVAGTLTDVITLDAGNVGIGVTPGASNKLDVYNGGTQLFYVNTSKYAYAKRWYDIDNPTYYLEPGSSATSLTIAGDISMATGKTITGSGLTFGNAGTTTIGGTAANTSGNLSVGGGTGTLTANKITVNTIDPPYWINGNKYATFVPSIIGVKEEIAKTIRLSATTNPKLFQYVVDFDNLTEGSDMWLFSRVVDLDQNMENLTVLLSSGSEARVFYKKDLANRRLIFFGNAPAEVSFRLTAPRFDHALHPLNATDTDEHGLRPGSYVLGNTPNGALPVADADLLAQLNAAEEYNLDDLGDIQLETTLTATPETSTVSLLDGQNQLIERFTAYTQAVIGKLRAGVIQTEHLSADSIAAPLATIETLNTTNLTAQTASISGTTKLGSLLTNTATVSGSITADSLFTQTASISSARMNYLESKVAELDVARATSFTAMTATISGTLYAENIADFDQKVANTFRQPSLIATLFGANEPSLPAPVVGIPASSAASLQKSLAELDLSETDIVINPAAVFIKNYFEVAGNSYLAGSVGIGSDLVIGDGLRLSNNEIAYSPTNGDPTVFKIQPSGVGRLELMAGRLTIDDTGSVTIDGDLRVAGAFTVEEEFVASGSALFRQGLLSNGNIEMIGPDSARTATLSANGAFSTISTVSAQTITATGVGSFGSLKLGTEVLTSTGSGTINTTQPTGKAKLSAGQTEITLKSELITPQTLIYVTPFGSTSNQVLFVKAQTAENLETTDKEGEFKVAVDQAMAQDVEFTWWIVN